VEGREALRRTSASVRGYWDTDRTEAFSDGVFAIAITLLVLDLSVSPAELDDLWRGIAHQWPAYLGYATSFITIGGIWMAHHSIFRRLLSANTAVMRINLGLLMAVAFLPFPTRLMAEALRHSQSAERTAVIFCRGRAACHLVAVRRSVESGVERSQPAATRGERRRG
jgi:uncharacterized membrane protein